MNKYQQQQLEQEQRLIQAIKASGAQVFDGAFGGCIRIVKSLPQGVRSQSVWLGRSGTIDRLKEILAA